MITPSDLDIKKGTIRTPKGGWKPQTYYIVDIAYSSTNVIHRSLLYTGFCEPKDPFGSYHMIINPASDDEVYFMSAVVEIEHLDLVLRKRSSREKLLRD